MMINDFDDSVVIDNLETACWYVICKLVTEPVWSRVKRDVLTPVHNLYWPMRTGINKYLYNCFP